MDLRPRRKGEIAPSPLGEGRGEVGMLRAKGIFDLAGNACQQTLHQP